MDKLAIIDTTSLLYYVAGKLSSEKSDCKDDFSKYKDEFDKRFSDLLDRIGTNKYIGFLDGSDNFRKRFLTSFKADRLNKKPLQFYNDLKYYAQEKYSLISSEDLESDDLCLIAANHYKDKYDVVIASPDSDLRQYPGKFYDYRHDNFLSISEDEAAKNLMKLLLIKGHNNKVKSHLPDCGEKTANAYLETHGTYSGIVDAYVYGIDKNNFPAIYKSVRGLGLLAGFDTLHRSFIQTYLLRTVEECAYLGIHFDIPNVLTLKKNTEEKFIW